MTVISIGNRVFELLDRSTEGLTDSQRETLDYLWRQPSRLSVREILNALNLISPAPLQVRLEHLEKRGKVRELRPAAA